MSSIYFSYSLWWARCTSCNDVILKKKKKEKLRQTKAIAKLTVDTFQNHCNHIQKSLPVLIIVLAFELSSIEKFIYAKVCRSTDCGQACFGDSNATHVVLVLKAPRTFYLDPSIHHASQNHKVPSFLVSH